MFRPKKVEKMNVIVNVKLLEVCIQPKNDQFLSIVMFRGKQEKVETRPSKRIFYDPLEGKNFDYMSNKRLYSMYAKNYRPNNDTRASTRSSSNNTTRLTSLASKTTRPQTP